MDSQFLLMLPQYIRLATNASAETIRNNKLTNAYSDTYFKIARQQGLAHARAWLLGSLIRDLHTA